MLAMTPGLLGLTIHGNNFVDRLQIIILNIRSTKYKTDLPMGLVSFVFLMIVGVSLKISKFYT